MKTFIDSNQSAIANDHDGDPVFLARNSWHLTDAEDKNPDIRFTAVK
jgi:peptide chain release factor 3